MSQQHPPETAHRFVRALVGGNFDGASALTAPALAPETLSPAALRGAWSRLVGHLGALAALETGTFADEGGRRVADFDARFERSQVTLRVVLDERDRVVGFWATPPRAPAYHPPGYVDAARFREEELSVGVEPALGATLTVPLEDGPWPAVVLVHGSGPNDRDERLGANRPFRDLAWGLASRGVAVLRYDKRTYAHPQDVLARGVTLDVETVDDALAALGVVRAVRGIDARRIVVLGHSLGAMLAPEIARRDGALAGVVMLAPAGRRPAEILADQLAHVASLRADAGQSTASLDAVRAAVLDLTDRRVPPDADVLGVPAAYWYDLEDRRPLDVARSLRVPMLALFGGRDYQVTGADAALWREALAGRGDTEVREMAALDHLFREGDGVATPASYLAERGEVSATVVDAVARWIVERAAGAPRQ